jgi:ribosomal protein S12 methylthiotransferase
MRPGSVYIENLGCAKNQVDAEVMIASLERAGWRSTVTPDDADLILVNTCGFIEPAQQESIDVTLSLATQFPDTTIALTGCLAQRFPDQLTDGLPEIAGVFGNRDPGSIDRFVTRIAPGERVVSLPEGVSPLPPYRRTRLLSHPGSAYVKIAEGCDHACSFCAIPGIRGSLRVRDARSVVAEVERLLETGVVEFNLIAQDLAAWHGGADTPDLTALIREILAIDGDFWLRPLYLYPDTFPLDLVRLSREDARLLPYFDLSFQHASPTILRQMGRPGSAERYLSLIGEIREIEPDAVLRSSVIVGFPGEHDAEFEELLAFLHAAELDWVGVFAFSPEEGTRAAALAKEVSCADPATVESRRRRIDDLQRGVMERRLRTAIGTDVRLLIEESIEGAGYSLARSRAHAPDVDGLVVLHHQPDAGPAPGSFVDATITGVRGIDLQAR